MGTHPIFESDFDCLTEMSDEIIDFSSKTVAKLKAECKSRSLPVSGKKQELIDRLDEYMREHASAEITEDDLLQDEPDVSIGEESQEQESPPAEKVEEPVPEPTQPVDDMEKRKLERAKKFGIEAKELVDEKKKSRAERFGLPTNGTAVSKTGSTEDSEMAAKKKSRAERFGLTVDQKRKAKLEGMDVAVDVEKIKKRQERFGNISSVAVDDKKAARAARFSQKV